jgi:hypothetical protein
MGVAWGRTRRKQEDRNMSKSKHQPKGGKKAKATKPRIKVVGDETPAPQTAPEATTTKELAAPKTRKKAERKDGGMSGLDAAAKILADAKEPLDCKTIVERAAAKGLWKSDGKTPSATIYSAIIREIAKKGTASRFQKATRGKFSAAS